MSAQHPQSVKTGAIKWGLALAIPILVYLGTTAVGIAQPHVLFYTVTSVALVLWALGLMSDTFVAISLPVAYIILQLAKPAQIMRPWASSVGWIVVGGLIFAQIMMRTGLAKRMALWALYLTRGSFNRLLWGILLAGFIIAPCIPSVMGKAALISVICIGICEALNLEKKSTAASAILLAGFLSIATAKIAFLTGGGDVVMYVGQMTAKTGVPITWGDYFIHNFPLAILYSILSMLTLMLVLRPKLEADSTSYIVEAHAALGPLSLAEKKAAGLIVVLILLLVTDRWHGIDAGWVMIMLSFVSFLPGIGLMNDDILQKTSFCSVFFVVGCMSIGAAAIALGVDKSLAGAVAPLMQGSSETVSMLLAYAAGTAMNFLLTPLAAFSAMTVPLTELALNMGLNPTPILYAFSYGLDQYIFPYEFAVLLFFFATGWVALKHIIIVFAVRFAVGGLFLLAVAKPWWSVLGLFEPLLK